MQRIAFGIRVYGKDTVAFFDDASFTFDPAENPGIALEERIPKATLRLAVQARNARAQVLANGKEIPITAGEAAVEVGEGLTVLGIRAEAAGENPGVSVRLAGHPESDGRWRVGTKEETGWAEAAFNDTPWPAGKAGPDGMMWAGAPGATTALLRQVVLWNETHCGPQRCVNPPAKEWGFSRGSMETFYLALFSPLPYRLDDYEFTLDVPAGFRLLDKTGYAVRHIHNNRPQKILTEEVRHGNVPYTRYRMFHAAGEVRSEGTQFSLLPVQMTPVYKGGDCRFYFRRSARGNFTELEQSLPVHILPPINGRMPRQIRISQYAPMGYSYLSREHLEVGLKQAAAAGWNSCALSWNVGWGPQWRDYMRLYHDLTTANGARVILWPNSNFPLYGTLCRGHVADDLFRWVEQTPGARARYFGDSVAWGPDHSLFCPQFVMNEGAARFRELVKEAYAVMLAGLPKADVIWNDWESHPWVAPDGKGSWCFCDRCKAAFREFAGLPAGADLSDAAILKEHRLRWETFRATVDGRLQAQIRMVCRDLGKPYMMYSWGSYEEFWQACRGNIDLGFPGTPGNAVADSHYQGLLDANMAFFRDKVGLPRVMGQRFSFFFGDAPGGGNVQVLSDDGYVQPRSWKTQILRVVAGFHGGVDLQNSFEYAAGSHYYIGEATRILSAFEPLFYEGERADGLAASEQVKYPNLLVLRRGKERLVLLFNEGKRPLPAVLANRNLQPGQVATLYGTSTPVKNPTTMKVTVPPEDVAVVHIR